VRKFVADGRVGEKMPVEVLRDGEKVELSVTLSEFQPRAALVPPVVPSTWLPAPAPLPPQVPMVPVPSVANALSGVTVRAITPQLAARYRLPDGVAGVIVQSVAPDSPAAGVLQPGDVIEQVNDDPVSSPQEFAAVAADLPPDAEAVLLLSRGRVRSFEVVTP